MQVDLDLTAFWAENDRSKGKPFRTDKPRAPLALPFDEHWLFEEMGLPSTIRYYQDKPYQSEINRECNDRIEKAIGLRPFNERISGQPLLRIEQVMGSKIELIENGTPWLEPGVSTIAEMHQKLDEIENLTDLEFKSLVCSEGGSFRAENDLRAVQAGSRAPATMATSILGTMNAMYWIVDCPDDMDRFFAVLGDTIIRYHRLNERESNVKIKGYYWLDDNCCLYSPELYARFCYPAMKRVFEAFAPEPEDYRYQHSDSEMRHLFPYLAKFDLKAVNFGPTIPVQVIREAMPQAEIHGQIAPMTLRNGRFDAIVAEVKRDFEGAGADGGLLITTAGSISAGTRLESIRQLMWAVQTHCRYD